MSLERACKNCEDCYNLRKSDKDWDFFGIRKTLHYLMACYMRNEAMKALEMDAKEAGPFEYGKGKGALEICRECDYSKPKIAEYILSERDKKNLKTAF